MFKIGDNVIHTNHGICKIEDIEEISYGGKKQSYYVLRPVFGDQTKIVLKIPVDNCSYLDSVLSKGEVNKIFNVIRETPEYWNDNPMKRTIEYKQYFQEKDFVNIGVLIKSITLRKEISKKLSSTDKRFLETAKMIFYGICCVAYNIKFENADEFFFKKISK